MEMDLTLDEIWWAANRTVQFALNEIASHGMTEETKEKIRIYVWETVRWEIGLEPYNKVYFSCMDLICARLRSRMLTA